MDEQDIINLKLCSITKTIQKEIDALTTIIEKKLLPCIEILEQRINYLEDKITK